MSTAYMLLASVGLVCLAAVAIAHLAVWLIENGERVYRDYQDRCWKRNLARRLRALTGEQL